MGTAATVAAVVHKDEKTIRMWRKEFKEDWGKFSEDGTGRYDRTTIIHDEECRQNGLVSIVASWAAVYDSRCILSFLSTLTFSQSPVSYRFHLEN